MKFSEQVKAFAAKTELKASTVMRNCCRKVSNKIAEGTPVSKGVLLGSWSPGINAVNNYSFKGGPSAWNHDLTVKDAATEESNRSAALSDLQPRINNTTDSLSWRDIYYFTNNTPWAKQAEHEGWLKTGPYGMREQGILEWNSIVAEEIGKLKK